MYSARLLTSTGVLSRNDSGSRSRGVSGLKPHTTSNGLLRDVEWRARL